MPAQPEQMVALGAVEVQGAGQGSEDLHGRLRSPRLLEPVEVVRRQPKDRELVAALVNENIVDADALLRRLAGGIDWPPGYLAESQTMLDRARGWLEQLAASPSDGATKASTDTAILDAIASPER